MSFAPIKLPYAEDALDPVVSAKTISFHYGKHHMPRTSTNLTNAAIKGTPLRRMLVPRGDRREVGAGQQGPARLSSPTAAQAWNHDFYWQSMKPKSSDPTGKIADALKDSFGGVKEFKEAFAKAAVAQFGSGWA